MPATGVPCAPWLEGVFADAASCVPGVCCCSLGAAGVSPSGEGVSLATGAASPPSRPSPDGSPLGFVGDLDACFAAATDTWSCATFHGVPQRADSATNVSVPATDGNLGSTLNPQLAAQKAAAWVRDHAQDEVCMRIKTTSSSHKCEGSLSLAMAASVVFEMHADLLHLRSRRFTEIARAYLACTLNKPGDACHGKDVVGRLCDYVRATCAVCAKLKRGSNAPYERGSLKRGTPGSRTLHVDLLELERPCSVQGDCYGHRYVQVRVLVEHGPDGQPVSIIPTAESLASKHADEIVRALNRYALVEGDFHVFHCDRGTDNLSQQMQDALDAIGARYRLTAVGASTSNGLAERMVQTVQHALRAVATEWGLTDPCDALPRLIEVNRRLRHLAMHQYAGAEVAQSRFGLRAIIHLQQSFDEEAVACDPRAEFSIGQNVLFMPAAFAFSKGGAPPGSKLHNVRFRAKVVSKLSAHMYGIELIDAPPGMAVAKVVTVRARQLLRLPVAETVVGRYDSCSDPLPNVVGRPPMTSGSGKSAATKHAGGSDHPSAAAAAQDPPKTNHARLGVPPGPPPASPTPTLPGPTLVGRRPSFGLVEGQYVAFADLDAAGPQPLVGGAVAPGSLAFSIGKVTAVDPSREWFEVHCMRHVVVARMGTPDTPPYIPFRGLWRSGNRKHDAIIQAARPQQASATTRRIPYAWFIPVPLVHVAPAASNVVQCAPDRDVGINVSHTQASECHAHAMTIRAQATPAMPDDPAMAVPTFAAPTFGAALASAFLAPATGFDA